MNTKTPAIFILNSFLSLVLCVTAFALCYEAAGGKLQPGSIARYIPSILRSYENDVPNGAVYTVQKNQGFYFKVCDEAGQVRHFMEKWAYPQVSNGDWQSILTTRDKSKIDVIKEIGVYKVKKDSATWEVWKFSKELSRPSAEKNVTYAGTIKYVLVSTINEPALLKLNEYPDKNFIVEYNDALKYGIVIKKIEGSLIHLRGVKGWKAEITCRGDSDDVIGLKRLE